jgi:hypothetical protein
MKVRIVEPVLGVRVEEVAEAVEHDRVEALRLGHEVGPVAERAGHVEPVLGQHGELLAHDGGVVAGPHPRAAGARPDVRSDPARARLRDGGSHRHGSSPEELRRRACAGASRCTCR